MYRILLRQQGLYQIRKVSGRMELMQHSRLALLFLSTPLFGLATDGHTCDTATVIPFASAAKLVVEKGQPQMPPVAKSLRLNGVVKVEVCVSGAGDVLATKMIRAHPILAGAALESAKEWRFKTEQNPFKTVLEIPFTNGIRGPADADEEKTNSAYFTQEDKCRSDLRSSNTAVGVLSCREASILVEKLPPNRMNERRTANQLVGSAYFRQRRFEDALGYYQTELAVALQSLHDYDAELGYAYHDVALAFHALGRTSNASVNYDKAEKILSNAIAHIGAEGLKQNYAGTLRRIREHHLVLLRQTDQTTAAANLESQIKESAQ